MERNMPNALIRLKENLHALPGTEKVVGEYILSHLDEMNNMSIQKLARKSYVSTSSIIRMSRLIGYRGYKEFKEDLIVSIALENENKVLSNNDISKDDTVEDIVYKITMTNIQSLYETQSITSIPSIKKSIDLMRSADNILLYGLGASYISAKDLYIKLLRINKPCTLNEDWHLQLLSARNSKPNDVAIVFSYSGQTQEIIECVKELKKNKTPIIAVTRCVETQISLLSDIRLYTTSNESLFRSAAMSSRISSLNIVDILYTCYANSTYSYTIKQLKRTHITKGAKLR